MKEFINSDKKYWKITEDVFIRAFRAVYSKKSRDSFLRNMHLKTANFFNNKSPSIRMLEEQTNNYFLAEDYFSLKKVISDISNFIVLYNSRTRYDLLRFWETLEFKNYDPI